MPFSINTRVLYTLVSALFIITGSFIAIRYAQGYQLSLTKRKFALQTTGLLSANSFPNGAYITVNGKRIGATDNTFYLEPGNYTVEVAKDGYFPWQKTIKIEPELVVQTNAQLYKLVSSLTPLTYTGIRNISPSPDGEKVLFYTASASAKNKNGLYVLELNTSLLNSLREPRQVTEEAAGFDLDHANFIWSPDNSQVILSTTDKDVVLDIGKKNLLSALPDVGFRKADILGEWESELYIRERQFLSKFPVKVQEVASSSAINTYLSPNKKKLIYTATATTIIPKGLIPELHATNSQPEERQLKPGFTYVYDSEEDKNFRLDVTSYRPDYQKIATSSSTTQISKIVLADDLSNPIAKNFTASPSSFHRLYATNSAQVAKNFSKYYSSLYSSGVQWFPDSKHILFNDGDHIFLMEYDNTNKTSVYSGPFDPQFIYPWPDGSKVLTLTSFSSTSLPNLYAIDLK